MFTSPGINIYTLNVRRLVAFYEGLGFTETFRVPRSGDPIHVELRLEHFTIGVASVDSAITHHGLKPELGGRPIEIVLWTDDTDGDFTSLTSAGALILSRPHDWLDGKLRIAWIADPDGNPIQLVQKR
jgi:predicted enzyme related to lactoylglutathione lyase